MYLDVDDFKLEILVTKRSNECPDFQGYVCCPCGFLEADETGEEGIARETYEETGYDFPAKEFDLFKVETEPELCNKGHVTLMYVSIMSATEMINKYMIYAEDYKIDPDESEEIAWIPVDEIGKYDWAFGHDKIINELMETL